MSLQNSYAEDLIPNMNVFGERPLKRPLRLNEVIRVGP